MLRRRAWHGACAFAAFSVLWTTLAFLLSGAPTTTPTRSSGSSAWSARRGSWRPTWPASWPTPPGTTATTVVAGVLLTGSFALLWAGRTSLAALIVGIVVLDIGTQGMQITNQAIIYALRPDARSRINSAYMVCYFVGGAAGSLAAGALYGSHGWAGVCLLGAGFGVLTLAVSASGALRSRVANAAQKRRPAAPSQPRPRNSLGEPPEPLQCCEGHCCVEPFEPVP